MSHWNRPKSSVSLLHPSADDLTWMNRPDAAHWSPDMTDDTAPVTLTLSRDHKRAWCLWCPDVVLACEPAATHPDLLDPFGDPGGIGHADCAIAHGFIVPGGFPLDVDPQALSRLTIRDAYRQARGSS